MEINEVVVFVDENSRKSDRWMTSRRTFRSWLWKRAAEHERQTPKKLSSCFDWALCIFEVRAFFAGAWRVRENGSEREWNGEAKDRKEGIFRHKSFEWENRLWKEWRRGSECLKPINFRPNQAQNVPRWVGLLEWISCHSLAPLLLLFSFPSLALSFCFSSTKINISNEWGKSGVVKCFPFHASTILRLSDGPRAF